jgi:hypothetical protein
MKFYFSAELIYNIFSRNNIHIDDMFRFLMFVCVYMYVGGGVY